MKNLMNSINNLVQNYHSANDCKIEIQIGRRKPYGFQYGLPEDVYYTLYSFFFFQNLWIERIFEVYHVFDFRHGDDKIRINDDGFKLREDFQPKQIIYIEDSQSGHGFQIEVSEKKPRLKEASLYQTNLYGPDVSRLSVDEVALKYTDHFSVIFQKIVNLRSMEITFSAKLRISIMGTSSSNFKTDDVQNHYSKAKTASMMNSSPSPQYSMILPSPKQILRRLFEMKICADIFVDRQMQSPQTVVVGLDNVLYDEIVDKAEKVYNQAVTSKDVSLDKIVMVDDLYMQPLMSSSVI